MPIITVRFVSPNLVNEAMRLPLVIPGLVRSRPKGKYTTVDLITKFARNPLHRTQVLSPVGVPAIVSTDERVVLFLRSLNVVRRQTDRRFRSYLVYIVRFERVLLVCGSRYWTQYACWFAQYEHELTACVTYVMFGKWKCAHYTWGLEGFHSARRQTASKVCTADKFKCFFLGTTSNYGLYGWLNQCISFTRFHLVRKRTDLKCRVLGLFRQVCTDRSERAQPMSDQRRQYCRKPSLHLWVRSTRVSLGTKTTCQKASGIFWISILCTNTNRNLSETSINPKGWGCILDNVCVSTRDEDELTVKISCVG